MIIKSRTEPEELKLFRYLNVRTNLSEKDQNYYLSLEKGYQGELMFDALINPLAINWLIINGLMLEYNHTVFQIDTLLISSEKIFVFEVKNYEGDYFLKDGRWYTFSKVEIRNPLDQLSRCESLLRRLLQELGLNVPIETNLVFIYPDFYLYHAPMDLPIIFPTQLNRLITQLSKNTKKYKESHLSLAKRLTSLHIEKSPYMRLLDYSYDQLKKGVTCVCCRSFNVEVKMNRVVCKECGHKEGLPAAVLRNVEEFAFLFPDRKITTNDMLEWFKVIESKITMRKLLTQNFNQLGHGKYSYYEKL
ncbi:nuclease-related domain-containing protein [Bacillus sp. JJ1773]|uniref:nuclease-related domain-containing protein n=1 Tax=Bacillus sp. JJ1773 TaxID=3122965 RepID=UPI003000A516